MSQVQALLVAMGFILTCAGIGQTAQVPAADEANQTAEESLEVRYARTSVQLTEARLRQARERNVRIANSVSQSELDRLRSNVELATELFASAQRNDMAWTDSIFRKYAEIAVVTAESELDRAEMTRSIRPESVSDADIEVLRLEVDMAKLNRSLGEQAIAKDADSELRWKVDLLLEEVIKLRREVNQLKRK